MKNILLNFIFILFSLLLNAQDFTENQIHEDFGSWNINVGENKISLSAFVTIEEIIENIDPYIMKLEMEINNRKQFKKIDKTKKTYQYKLYLKSNSIFENDSVSTWIRGVRIFISDKEITKEKFPEGFTFKIEQEPTLMYKYLSTKNDLNFSIVWDSVTYENRDNN